MVVALIPLIHGKGPNSFVAATQNTGITGITNTGAGVYSVSVTDNNGCISASATTASVVVNSLPMPITATATPNPICSGSNLVLEIQHPPEAAAPILLSPGQAPILLQPLRKIQE